MPAPTQGLIAEALADLFLEFVEPLLHGSTERSIETLRSSLRLGEMAWNLPLLPDDPISNQARRSFDEAVAVMPAIGARALRQLVEDRMSKFGHILCPLDVRVEGADLETATVLVRRGTSGGSRSA